MGHRSLSGNSTLESTSLGAPIDRKHLVGVSLTRLRLDTGQFQSSDPGGAREGMVAVSVAGQDSLFSYSGKGVVDIPTQSQLCFLGKNPGPLSLNVRVVESDKSIRQALAKMETVAETAKNIFSATSVPLAGNALGAGAAFFSLLKKLAKDTHEATVFTVMDSPLSGGADIRLRVGENPDSPLVDLTFHLHDFGKRDTLRMTSVQIAGPWFDFDDKTISIRTKSPTGKGFRRKNYSVEDWLAKNQRLKHLVFSAASGRHKAGVSLPFNHLDRSHWQNLEAFRVASGRTGEQRIIPVAMSFSLRSDQAILEPLLDFFSTGVDLAGEINPEFDDPGDVLKKAGRSLGDLIAEWSPEALSLFQFDGALMLLPEGVTAQAEAENGLLQLGMMKPGHWQKSIVCDLRRRKRFLGRFGFDIRVDLVS